MNLVSQDIFETNFWDLKKDLGVSYVFTPTETIFKAMATSG